MAAVAAASCSTQKAPGSHPEMAGLTIRVSIKQINFNMKFKLILGLLIYCLCNYSVFGQGCPPLPPSNLIINGSFETPIVPISNIANAAFNDGLVTGWAASNGTPSVCNPAANWELAMAFEGVNFACISSDHSFQCLHNEAFFQQVPFEVVGKIWTAT